MTRLVLWLAEVTDRWARALTADECGERLATANRRVHHLDERLLAMRRHPAGSKLAKG